MNSEMTKYPEIPQLFYSTWGSDFYSEHWLRPLNCWMFGLIKYVEANIDLSGSRDTVKAFEIFSGSDLMFIYPDPTQRTRVHEAFLEQYRAVAKHAHFDKREVLSTYPVDPFKTLFIYVTADKPKNPPVFMIDKLSFSGDKSISKIELEPDCMEVEGLSIYFQFFMLPPDTQFDFSVEGRPLNEKFTSPAFGIPLHIVTQLTLKPKYNQPLLYEKLQAIWGRTEDIPIVSEVKHDSHLIHSQAGINKVLDGKRVAVFKYNKELYSILRFQDLTPFSLEVVFDEVISLADASEYIQSDLTNVPVVNDIDRIADFNFDALVLTCALNFETEVPFFKALMKYALENDIPVVSLYDDVLLYDVFDDRAINPDNFYRIGLSRPEMIPEVIPTPQECAKNVLGVFGTDTVQGKFTTQLYLREELKKLVKVAHWATEPTGSLLGADIGYSRVENDFSDDQRLAFERSALKDLADSCDVVITGGQNSIIFAPPGARREDNSSTFIYDTMLPRYIVLTVSVDTPLNLVEDSIAYIAELAAKYGIESEVIALAMMGGRKIHGGRWTETYFSNVDNVTVETAKQKLNESFGLPLFLVPQETAALAETVAAIVGKND